MLGKLENSSSKRHARSKDKSKKREIEGHYPSPGWNLGMNICFIYEHCFNSSTPRIIWSVKFKFLEKYDICIVDSINILMYKMCFMNQTTSQDV